MMSVLQAVERLIISSQLLVPVAGLVRLVPAAYAFTAGAEWRGMKAWLAGPSPAKAF